MSVKSICTSLIVISSLSFPLAPAKAESDKSAVALARAAELAAIRARHDQVEREVAATLKLRQDELRKEKGLRSVDRTQKGKSAGDVQAEQDGAGRHDHWDYDGEAGPARWGKLNPAWTKCEVGTRQSPIDIRDGIQVDLETPVFEYKPSAFNVVDNGHTVQVNVGPGNRVTLTGRSYELVQFHFHRPSEEKIAGRGFDMVAHLVHKDNDGRLLIVAVLMESGKPHSLVQTVWNNLPLEKNDPLVPTITIDLNQLLPSRTDYYTYMGSLTTPPCTEGVLWVVMKEPIQVSAQQIGIFGRLYPMNARPAQANSGRLIKESN